MIDLLPGFRDFTPKACALRNHIFKGWRTVANHFCFEEFDGPILESLELFTKKSGDEIVEQLFAFEDKGQRKIALRPEMTPSLVRILGSQIATLKRPTKWFNITENFRYERPQKGRLRSFYQFNVDIVGEASYTADAELIALAIESFKFFGLNQDHFYVRLSDRQLWMLWLEKFEIKDSDIQAKILNLFDKWERRSHEAIEKDLATLLPESVSAEQFFQLTEVLRNCKTLEAIQACFEKNNINPINLEGLLTRLKEWQLLLKELETLGCQDYVQIDLSIVRGLAYYTGFVFEVFEKSEQGRALAGGGRYDKLFEKLTGHSMPAVGFAAGDVTLTDLLMKQNLLPTIPSPCDCFVVFEETERTFALQLTQELRQKNNRVSYLLGEIKSLSKQLKKAYNENPKFIIICTHEEFLRNTVQIKNTDQQTEQVVPIANISQFISQKENA